MQEILNGGQLTIQGATGNRVLLQSAYTEIEGNPPGVCPPSGDAAYWQIDFLGAAAALVDEVDVELSESFEIILGTNIGGSCVINWQANLPIVASETRDTDENGRIDRIRASVTTGVTLNDDFSNFTARVGGYEVVGYGTGAAAGDRHFVIDIEEGDELDTDATPTWLVVSNASLEATTGITRFVESGVETPTDNSPPLVAHTLTYPGATEIFVKFSEPVYRNQATTTAFATTDFLISSGQSVNAVVPDQHRCACLSECV